MCVAHVHELTLAVKARRGLGVLVSTLFVSKKQWEVSVERLGSDLLKVTIHTVVELRILALLWTFSPVTSSVFIFSCFW